MRDRARHSYRSQKPVARPRNSLPALISEAVERAPNLAQRNTRQGARFRSIFICFITSQTILSQHLLQCLLFEGFRQFVERSVVVWLMLFEVDPGSRIEHLYRLHQLVEEFIL